MKTLRLFIGLALFIIAFAQCDQKENEVIPQDTKEEVKLFTEITQTDLSSIVTKADTAGFYNKKFKIVTKDNRTSNKFTDRVLTGSTPAPAVSKKAEVTLSQKLYWDDLGGRDADLQIIGIHPDTTYTDEKVGWDLTLSPADLEKNDLMMAHIPNYLYTDKENPANLLFKHVLSKVTIIIESGSYTKNELSNAVVTYTNIPAKGKVSIAPTSKVYTYTDTTRHNISNSMRYDTEGKTGYAYSAIIFPFNGKKDERIATVTVEGNTYNIKLPNDVIFTPGVNHRFNVTINKSDIVVTASVTDWENSDLTPISSQLINVGDFVLSGTTDTPDTKVVNGSILRLGIFKNNTQVASTIYKASVTPTDTTWVIADGASPMYWDNLNSPYDTYKLRTLLTIGTDDTKGDSIFYNEITLPATIQPAVSLGKLSHPLAKVTVKVETNSDSGATNAIDLDDIKSVTFPDSWKAFEIDETNIMVKEKNAALACEKKENYEYVAFVLPTKSSNELCKIRVSDDDGSSKTYDNTYTVNATVSIEANKHYKYTVIITKSEIKATGQVVDWENVSAGDIPTEL